MVTIAIEKNKQSKGDRESRGGCTDTQGGGKMSPFWVLWESDANKDIELQDWRVGWGGNAHES